ncbi:MAG: DUF1634 domain-containing protein [Thermoproteus sp. AZ2]|uniref:DUF1634 domain-containing protein n=1 Tax=Thermoproteus sp. AZ2 TaxID=1609232 RepID=A0ACC6V1H0_9CREN
MELEDIIGWTLRIGVIISIALILLGLVFLIVKPPEYHIFRLLSSPTSPINSSALPPLQSLTGIYQLNGIDVILLGLMVLIATPVIRVLMGIVQFARERNYLYVIITIIVLFNLLFQYLLYLY